MKCSTAMHRYSRVMCCTSFLLLLSADAISSAVTLNYDSGQVNLDYELKTKKELTYEEAQLKTASICLYKGASKKDVYRNGSNCTDIQMEWRNMSDEGIHLYATITPSLDVNAPWWIVYHIYIYEGTINWYQDILNLCVFVWQEKEDFERVAYGNCTKVQWRDLAPPPPVKTSSGKNATLGIIIGVVAAVLVLLLIIAVTVNRFFRRRRELRMFESAAEHETGPQSSAPMIESNTQTIVKDSSEPPPSYELCVQ
ncbi:uncharacterized protein [Watersipora subatra]|uniref:uncharacterized protein isoform X1 n=1 Tax=Watersipora subatra TaxID=2589382 RepID=UPI00355C1ED4